MSTPADLAATVRAYMLEEDDDETASLAALAELERLAAEAIWVAGVNKALMPYQERAVAAEAEVAELHQRWQDDVARMGREINDRQIAAEAEVERLTAERDLARRQLDRHAEGWNDAEQEAQVAARRAQQLEEALRMIVLDPDFIDSDPQGEVYITRGQRAHLRAVLESSQPYVAESEQRVQQLEGALRVIARMKPEKGAKLERAVEIATEVLSK